MNRSHPSASPRPHNRLLALLATLATFALLGAACSSDDTADEDPADDSTSDGAGSSDGDEAGEDLLYATVDGEEVRTADVEQVGEFLHHHREEDVERTLVGLAIDETLFRQGLEQWLPGEGEGVEPGNEELHDRFDQWLRDPSNAAEVAADLLTRYPDALEMVCGNAVVVAPDAAEATRSSIESGAALVDAAPAGSIQLSTADLTVAPCDAETDLPSQVHAAVTSTPVGSIVEATANDPSTGNPVAVFAEPLERRPASEAEQAAVAARLATRLSEGGYGAWKDVVHTQAEVAIEESGSTWDEHAGVISTDAAVAPDTFERTAATTTAPPANPEAPTAPAGTPDSGLGTLLHSVDPGTADPIARAQAAITAGVPQAWRDAVPVTFSQIGGSSSLSSKDGRIQMGSSHLAGDWKRLIAIATHEFGHHIAFRYGTQSQLGAPPEGWPTSGAIPVEHWADCVSRSFTAYPLASHHQGTCVDPELGWTALFLDAGPDAHPKTR